MANPKPATVAVTVPDKWRSLKTAVVVCGHAVYNGGPSLDPSQAPLDKHWLLQPFQEGEGKYYIAHVKAGIHLASVDSESLLIFSGGQTRAPCILSEAQGYHHVAEMFRFWGETHVRCRTTTEEFSRDSFDNVLFSIARFKECVGHLPEKFIIVSWTFKQARFDFHTWSIRWPQAKYQFVGFGVPEDEEKAKLSETNTLKAFKLDVSGYGTTTDAALGIKKAARNPFRRQHGYSTSCPDMAPVLAWRGQSRVLQTDVPWA